MEYPSTLTIPTFDGGVLNGDVEQPKYDVYTESATQRYALGTKLVYPSRGTCFRYAKNGGTALAKALMTTSEALLAAMIDELQGSQGAGIIAGLEEFEIDMATGGSWTEDEFAGGKMVVNKSTGIGDIYHILANAINSSDDTLMRVRVTPAIQTTLSATSELTLTKSAWRDVDVMPVTAEGTPAGVPLIAVTADYYCWLQTGGYAPLIVDTGDTLIKGGPCGYPEDPAVPGAVGDINAHTDAEWGIVVYIATPAEVAIVDLKLDS